MQKKLNSTIIIAIAVCTSAALIAFAFDQRHEASVITVPAVAFYLAAAIICLLPYTLLRRKSCRNKTPNAG
jgi:uncharacterized membrane protein YqjE